MIPAKFAPIIPAKFAPILIQRPHCFVEKAAASSLCVLEKRMASDGDPHIGLSHGPGGFSPEEFEKAAQEVLTPDLSGYEFFVESHGTKIYRHYREVRQRGS